MRNIFTLFILLGTLLHANNNYELKLYEKILPVIFKEKTLNVYADAKSKELLKHSDKFKILQNCDEDTIVLITDKSSFIPDLCKDKPIFATSYSLYKNNTNSFGAFYWRKGRPQIIFKNEAIKQFNLKIPKNLQKYIK